jgi:putative transcriptional regulator
MKTKRMTTKVAAAPTRAVKSRAVKPRVAKPRSTIGGRIIKGLEQAVAWTRGNNDRVRVTLVQVPEIDVRKVRRKMGLSQSQFATRFGFPPATLRNWEQGRARPDAPTRVLLAVIAKHPETVEEVLRQGMLESRCAPLLNDQR